MDWQNSFYMFGVFFFISWFVFLTVAVIAMIILLKRMQEIQASMQQRLDNMQQLFEQKLNAPGAKILLSLIPLIPTIMGTGRKWLGRKKTG